MEAATESDSELASPGAMKELIQYFETHGRFLDRQELMADVPASQSSQLVSDFVSCIRFNGVPILPPVMTSSKRDEVIQEKKRAVFKENRRTARRSRRDLVERAHSLLESAEAGHPSEPRSSRPSSSSSSLSAATAAGVSSRLGLERPMVLKPVVTSAWGSVNTSSSTTASVQILGERGSGSAVTSSVHSLADRGSNSTASSSLHSVAERGVGNTMASSVQSLDSASSLAPGPPSSLALHTFATAEQGVVTQEEFGLQTLDSLCSDFMSMEDSLPTDFNGVPLMSIRQQKISHDLLRLSRILKVKDMNSTGGSDISELPLSEYAGQGQGQGEGSDERGRGVYQSALDAVSASFCQDSQDTVVEVSVDTCTGEDSGAGADNTSAFMDNNPAAGTDNTSGFMDNSTDSLPGEGTSSGANTSGNTSGMSSANTTGTLDSRHSSRSSPRSNLKNNTVHFASFVTEYIDTSASLSSENITVVKKKLPGDKLAKDRAEVKDRSEVKGAVAALPNVGLLANKEGGQDLLSNVSLAEPDSPITSTPPSLPPGNLPFQSYMKTDRATDPSSSDKENDSGQSNKPQEPGVKVVEAGRSGGSTTSGGGPLKEGHAVSDSQGSCKSDATATTSESSNSTLIEDVAAAAAAAASLDSVNGALPLNIPASEEASAKPSEAHKPGGSSDSHKHGSSSGPPLHKRLPPEPPQQSYQPVLSLRKSGDRKNRGVKKEDSAENSFHKGHIRRGSYTLNEPSPVLLRSQVVSGREGAEECGGQGGAKGSEELSKPLNIPVQSHVPSEPEAAGKAEHINRYLSQVQLHNSEDLTASQMSAEQSHNYHDFDDDEGGVSGSHLPQSSLSMLQAMASSHRSLVASSISSGAGAGEGEAVQKLQTLRQTLMEQQQRELEELFVQQRREQMLLQQEIEDHQRRMKEHQEFLTCNAPENIKLPSRKHSGELSPDSNAGSSTCLKLFTFPSPQGHTATQASHQSNTGHGTHGQGIGGGASHQSNTLLLNSSAASSSPKVKRPVLRSPIKFHQGRRPTGKVIVPPQAYDPEMAVKFDKLTAAAKGFLCRRLLVSDKVQGLVKTIKDTREFAFSFQSETPIRQGNFSNQDRTLLERIVAQLQAALLDVHEIFFDTPVAEQMSLIEQTRLNNREKRIKSSVDEVSVRTSAPRISLATLKAQERRRRAMEAENAVFGSMNTARPRTAPPTSSFPHTHTHASTDLSGPLKRHYQSLLSKAMKQSVLQATHLHHSRQDSSRTDMERPQTAPERSSSSRVKRSGSGSGSHGQATSHTTDSGQPRLNIRPKASQQPASSQSAGSSKTAKASKPSSKSWR